MTYFTNYGMAVVHTHTTRTCLKRGRARMVDLAVEQLVTAVMVASKGV